MKREQLNNLIRDSETRRHELMIGKAAEYTKESDDRLANFKNISKSTGVSPLAVWLVYAQKHFDAITNFVRTGKEKSEESIEGRIDDLQNYLDLLRGLVWEKKNGEEESPICNDVPNE